MPETMADLEVRVGWNDSRFRANSNRTKAQFNRDAASIEARARQMDNRLASTGSRFGKGFGNKIQQIGFQVGDFSTQVAGGQSALRAFIQQGTQVAGAFGPLGAVIGAVGATVGALAVSLIGAEDASNDLADAMSGLSEAGSNIDSLNARIAESSGVVRDALIKERDATLGLLKARLSLARSKLAEENAAIDERANTIAFQSAAASGVTSPSQQFVELSRLKARLEILQGDPEATAVIAGLESQIAIAESGLAKIDAGAGAGGTPVFGSAGASSRARKGGGGSRSRTQRDRFEGAAQKVQERLQALQLERQQIGLTEGASLELSAAFEREKLERELIAAAQKDGTAATAEEIALAQNLASEVETLTIAIFDEKEAIEAVNDAAKQAKKDQDDLARSISSTADKFVNAVQNAESFEDALKKIGLQLLELAANAAVGKGPLGGLFNELIGVGANGVFGTFADGAAFSNGNVIPFASGGIVKGPTTFPMRGGTGLMGEAGPEAIMPLSRGSDGRLGVAASGGGTAVTVNIKNEVGGTAEASMNGNQLDVVIKRVVASDIASGGPVHRSLTKTFQIANPTTRR